MQQTEEEDTEGFPRKIDAVLAVCVDELYKMIHNRAYGQESLDARDNLAATLGVLVDTIILESVMSTAPETTYLVECKIEDAEKGPGATEVQTLKVKDISPDKALEQLKSRHRSTMTRRYTFRIIGEE